MQGPIKTVCHLWQNGLLPNYRLTRLLNPSLLCWSLTNIRR